LAIFAVQAGRRRFLHLACVHFSRELVLDDGFSRLNNSELSAALRWSINEFRSKIFENKRFGFNNKELLKILFYV
jgi:hypothetical protein